MEVNPGFAWKKEKTRHNSPLLPDSIRGLIVGSSNCGKTTLILNLLLNPGWLDYNRLYVFGKSLHQKEYQVLRTISKLVQKSRIDKVSDRGY